MWFIGLEFERTENLNVDLTESIQNFTQQVHNQAVSICLIFLFLFFGFLEEIKKQRMSPSQIKHDQSEII